MMSNQEICVYMLIFKGSVNSRYDQFLCHDVTRLKAPFIAKGVYHIMLPHDVTANAVMANQR